MGKTRALVAGQKVQTGSKIPFSWELLGLLCTVILGTSWLFEGS